MKIDMHVHTKYSLDGTREPFEFVDMARKIGLSGIAITDHNEVRGALEAREYAKEIDFLVIVGEEISTDSGHILAYNIRKEIERDLTPEETVKRINDQGGFAVVAHPDRFPSGIKKEMITGLKVVGIEVMNGATVAYKNNAARCQALKLDKGMVGGSDAHSPKKIGTAYTVFEGSSLSAMDIQQHVSQKRSRAEGKHLSYFRQAGLSFKIFCKYLMRGGKKI